MFYLFISDFAILHFHVELKDEEGNIKIKSGLKIVEELKSKLKDTQFHLDSAIGQFNQKLYDELDKNENGNIIFSPFRSDI